MLQYTQPQQAFVRNSRTQFNASQVALSNARGLTDGQAMVGNALPMPRDVWGMWDREALEVQRDELAVFNNLAASVATPMPLGKIVHHFQTVSDSGSVNISLDGQSEAPRDQPVYDYHGTPLPIIDSTFGFGWRQVMAAQTEGIQLDPAARNNADRRVAEKLESIALDGDAKIVVGGARLHGLRTHPKRSTRATGVTINGANGTAIITEVVAVLKLLHTNNFRVPATIYMNWDDWFYAGNTDFSSQYPGKTILQRVMEIAGVREIVPATSLNANEIIALIKDRRVVQVLNGMPATTLPRFRANPEDDYNFKRMAAAAVEIKFDAENQCGIAHSA